MASSLKIETLSLLTCQQRKMSVKKFTEYVLDREKEIGGFKVLELVAIMLVNH
jgi:hypothetical protein